MRLRTALVAIMSAVLTVLVMPSTAWADESTIVREFTDAAGRHVVLREGRFDPPASGFGWSKIVNKHKITNMALVEKIIKNPNGGRDAGGTARHYDGLAIRYHCDISNRCTEVERIPLLAVVDFRAAPEHGGGQKGVITAFCNFGDPQHVECPSWVNNLANVQ